MLKNEGSQQDRSAIEKRIIASSNQIRWGTDTGCFMEEEIDEFIMAWYDLLNYYTEHQDSQISVEVVREYVQRCETFARVMNDDQVVPDCRKIADDAGRISSWCGGRVS